MSAVWVSSEARAQQADDDTAAETRRAPSWRPQAPSRPDMPAMPPGMDRPEIQFEVARPEIDLPVLDLGSEQLSAQPPEELSAEPGAEDAPVESLVDDDINFVDESGSSEAIAEQPAPNTPADPAAVEDAVAVDALASEDLAEPAAQNAVAEAGSGPQAIDQAIDQATDPVSEDAAAEAAVAGSSQELDPVAAPEAPPVELSTAAVLPQERQPVLPDLDQDLSGAGSASQSVGQPAAQQNEQAQEPLIEPAGSSELVATRWVRPTYPRSAYRKGTEGWVKLRVSVGPDGQITDIALVDSKPRGVFVREAVRAANQWEFEPIAAHLPQVSRSKTYQIDFTLNE